MKQVSPRILIASLKSGNEVICSQRDYLMIQEYCANVGMNIEVIKKEGLNLTIKKK